MTTLRLTLSAALLLLCSAQTAALTIKEYQDGKNGNRDIRDITTAYMSGMGAAYTWANSELERDRQPLLFCQPRTLALRPDLLTQLLDREIQNPAYRPEHPIEAALIFALKRAFPC